MAALEVSAYDDGHGLALRADFDKHAQKMVRMAGFNPFQGEPDIPMPRGEGLAEIAERAGRQAVIVMAADARHTWVSGGGGSWVGRQSEETVSAALTALMEAQIRLAELIASMSSSRQLSDMGTGPATNSAVLGLAAGEDAALAALDQAQFAASYMADQAEMARA
ncbi:MAG: hypothetical protein OXI20_16055 [Rhodospirillales bacterium]|nr:hypothetical protein [Rhodospirillales bacterium]